MEPSPDATRGNVAGNDTPGGRSLFLIRMAAREAAEKAAEAVRSVVMAAAAGAAASAAADAAQAAEAAQAVEVREIQATEEGEELPEAVPMSVAPAEAATKEIVVVACVVAAAQEDEAGAGVSAVEVTDTDEAAEAVAQEDGKAASSAAAAFDGRIIEFQQHTQSRRRSRGRPRNNSLEVPTPEKAEGSETEIEVEGQGPEHGRGSDDVLKALCRRNGCHNEKTIKGGWCSTTCMNKACRSLCKSGCGQSMRGVKDHYVGGFCSVRCRQSFFQSFGVKVPTKADGWPADIPKKIESMCV